MFESLQESQFADPHTVDPDGLIAFLGWMGWSGALPEEARGILLNDLRSRLTADEYRLPFETHVYSARLAVAARPPS